MNLLVKQGFFKRFEPLTETDLGQVRIELFNKPALRPDMGDSYHNLYCQKDYTKTDNTCLISTINFQKIMECDSYYFKNESTSQTEILYFGKNAQKLFRLEIELKDYRYKEMVGLVKSFDQLVRSDSRYCCAHGNSNSGTYYFTCDGNLIAITIEPNVSGDSGRIVFVDVKEMQNEYEEVLKQRDIKYEELQRKCNKMEAAVYEMDDRELELSRNLMDYNTKMKHLSERESKIGDEIGKINKQKQEFEQYRRDIINDYEKKINLLEQINPYSKHLDNFRSICSRHIADVKMVVADRSSADELPCLYMHMFANGKAYVGITMNPYKRWDAGNGVDNELNNYNAEFTKDMHSLGGPRYVKTVWAHVPDWWTKEKMQEVESEIIRSGDYTQDGYNIRR